MLRTAGPEMESSGALYPLASEHFPETIQERWGILHCDQSETLLQDYSLHS